MKFNRIFKWLKRHRLLMLALILGFGTRFYQLAATPPSLYWDEAAIAYDAFSIAETGRDMHGRPWWQPIFYSYGDYKAPVYIWLAAVATTFFGPSELSVRLPSALLGSLTIVIIYAIAQQLWSKRLLSTVAAFIAALSPLGIQFSRAAFEANIGLFLVCLTLLLLLASRKRQWLIGLIPMVGALAVYAYASARFVIPILWLATFLTMANLTKLKNWLWHGIALFGFGLLLIPLLTSPDYAASNQYRLSNANLFRTDSFILQQNIAREQTGNTLVSRLVYHRWWYFGHDFLINMLTHADLRYLFFWGDLNLRHATGQSGLMLISLIIPFLAGVYAMASRYRRIGLLLLVYWVAAVLPAALVYEVPHSLRSLNTLPVLCLLAAVGIRALYLYFHKYRSIFVTSFFLITGLSFSLYFHDYLTHYPERSQAAWMYGYKQVALTLQVYEPYYPIILVDEIDRYWLYHLLYQRILPQDAQRFIEELGKGTLAGQYQFGRIDEQSLIRVPANALILLPASRIDFADKNALEKLETISDLNGKPLYYLFTRSQAYASTN